MPNSSRFRCPNRYRRRHGHRAACRAVLCRPRFRSGDRSADVTIDVDSAADKRHCTVGHKKKPESAAATKAEINALMGSPQWQNVKKRLFEQTGTVTDLATFDHQGYTGIEMTVTPKAGPAAEALRMVVSTIETAKGRTALICVADRDSFGAALPEFRAVRATIRAPE